MNIRQVYVVENHDWLAPKSNLTDQQAYDAIVRLWHDVSGEQYDAAIADMATAGLCDGAEDDRG